MARMTGRAKPMTAKAGIRKYDNPKENNNPYIQL